MKLRLIDPEGLIPDAHTAAEAAVRGVEVLIIEHLRKKNDGTKPNRNGLPKTNYYAAAANEKNVEASVVGATIRVEIDHPGLAMHYEGGTVYPKKKALAIPIDPAVAGIWPSEANAYANEDEYALIWPKNSSHGFIKDIEQNRLLWLLIPKATIKADKSVLPTDEETLNTAEKAVWEAFS